MKASLRQRQQLVSPGVRQLRESMQEHDARFGRSIEARFENVQRDTVDVHAARADADR
jgi:hypothetical protein